MSVVIESLDGAAVAVRTHRRDQLDPRCRSLVRLPLALDRLTETTGGLLLSPRRRPWRDDSTARLDPLALLARVAALVPAPCRPWLAYHFYRCAALVRSAAEQRRALEGAGKEE